MTEDKDFKGPPLRSLLGVIGAIVLMAAGVRMLSIGTDAGGTDFTKAAGIFAIGMASIPLLLIGREK